jgi:peptidoglycan hydrolase-like protein with peptidoglycan-binding domain
MIPVAAQYNTVSSRVIDREASLREETVPAVYKTVTRQVVDVAASTREIDVPAQYQNLSSSMKVSEASEQWRSILCETNATPSKIVEIQQALSKAGYNPGPMDGVIRAQTMSAVNGYQTAKGLPVDAYLNLETVKSLGVSPK